ncbi:hypothetical protein KQX54_015577 [Cotesia glomerata]|uniref:Uncharacterized protein n=1 Tax=Cotesia glomerata TaxID=32391 RepID=A0AAV7HT31_COTGL|nr:hypothetical protein KQX54_015577 [Cotesia glomerata]
MEMRPTDTTNVRNVARSLYSSVRRTPSLVKILQRTGLIRPRPVPLIILTLIFTLKIFFQCLRFLNASSVVSSFPKLRFGPKRLCNVQCILPTPKYVSVQAGGHNSSGSGALCETAFLEARKSHSYVPDVKREHTYGVL